MVKFYPVKELRIFLNYIAEELGNADIIVKAKALTLLMYWGSIDYIEKNALEHFRDIYVAWTPAWYGIPSTIVVALKGSPPKGVWLLPYSISDIYADDIAFFYSHYRGKIWELYSLHDRSHAEAIQLIKQTTKLLIKKGDKQ